ncbi:uncharacterized protein LOC131183164 [Hevea brasiliensis]|uniref:uncharacterized protein LOC131183164 n=1 Tax=Hevea brasiliensis TaxID=3981 RepID=UPI0025DA4C07|nr:uncharacterized protein LOC131183164 [Hevea brasiliensis]
MYALAARPKGNNDRQIAQAVIAGFTGQLKGWWDFSLSDEGKRQIIDSVKTEQTTEGQTQEQLLNLRCPDLSHFKWYKDTFFSLIFVREDNHFGELASEVVTAGLTLCNELRLQRQLQKERITGKRLLGDFCEQYGLPPVTFPNKGKVKKSGRESKKRYKKHRTFYPQTSKRSKKPVRSKPVTSSKKKKVVKRETNVVCYKCGKTGHYANKCKVKQQIQALEINDNLKDSLIKILLNESESEEDLEVNVLDYTSEESSTEPEPESSCDGKCDYYKSLCTLNGLCVLTKE